MNLHANAALSWIGRRRLCELVVEEGWTVVGAAALRAVAARRARSHRREEARPDQGRRRLARPRPQTALQLHLHRPRWSQATDGGLGEHVAVDDYSRLAYAEVLADERASSAIG